MAFSTRRPEDGRGGPKVEGNANAPVLYMALGPSNTTWKPARVFKDGLPEKRSNTSSLTASRRLAALQITRRHRSPLRSGLCPGENLSEHKLGFAPPGTPLNRCLQPASLRIKVCTRIDFVPSLYLPWIVIPTSRPFLFWSQRNEQFFEYRGRGWIDAPTRSTPVSPATRHPSLWTSGCDATAATTR